MEQLRVHVRNLTALCKENVTIDIFEKGYGKDSAGIAREALTHAAKEGYDVVLIDTAGRMQDNEPLMRALSKVRGSLGYLHSNTSACHHEQPGQDSLCRRSPRWE